MKNALKKAISVLLVAVMVFSAAPLAGFVGLDLNIIKASAEEIPTSGTCGQNLTWTLDESTGELVISGTGEMSNYTSSYYSSTAPWYYNRSAIRYVTISDGVTSIGKCAFQDCDNLKSVIIGNNVISIGESAFEYCDSLASVTIPGSITSIGNYAFLGCDSLTSSYYPGTPEQWESISVGIGDNLRKRMVFDCNSEKPYYGGFCGESINWKLYVGSTELIISGTGEMANYSWATIGLGTYVTVAPWGEFFSSIKSVTISNGVTTIGDFAFYGCTSLADVTIPNSVTSIGTSAFGKCTNLISITIPNSVTTIGDDAFSGCKNIVKINVPLGISEINPSAFYGCLSIVEIVISNSVTAIGESAFYGCDSLKSIVIPDSVTTIESKSFYDCDKLESVSLGNNVKTIGEKAFYGCDSLNSITIPSSVEEMSSAFEYCNKLKNVKISNGVTTISDNAFRRCWELTNVTIPDSVESIKQGAFDDCGDITDVYYSGSKSEWEQILIGGENEDLTSAKIHYNYIWNGNGGSTETPEMPDNIPDYDSSVTDKYLVPTPTETTISYGDSIILHVDPSKIPEGGYVEWHPSNSNFSYSVSSDGTTCTITPEKKGDTTFTVLIYDAEGNIVSADTQTMTSKAGFFDKIIAFFKKLFGLTKTIPEAVNVIC